MDSFWAPFIKCPRRRFVDSRGRESDASDAELPLWESDLLPGAAENAGGSQRGGTRIHAPAEGVSLYLPIS